MSTNAATPGATIHPAAPTVRAAMPWFERLARWYLGRVVRPGRAGPPAAGTR
ncbi:hypothetical protein ACQP60_19785 [Isoptericola variabilis]|uniref:hypothetical protein n=1 Tax=Isoptericola variabilis TaxID=139208 RepID=UPI003D244D14